MFERPTEVELVIARSTIERMLRADVTPEEPILSRKAHGAATASLGLGDVERGPLVHHGTTFRASWFCTVPVSPCTLAASESCQSPAIVRLVLNR